MDIAARLIEELESKTVFEIPIPIIGKLPVPESAIVTWGIMAFIMIITLIFVRNLQIVPNRKQMVIEVIVNFIYDFFYGILGKEGKRYIPYLGTVFIYLICANVIGLLGFKPPTKELNVTAGMAIMSIVLIEYSGIHEKKLGGWVKSFAHPMPLMIPFNIMELFIRPMSLCMRLFGNIFGAFVIMELLKMFVPAIIPIPFSMYFDIFDGCLQAYIFVLLTSIFMQEKLEA